jgi:hypothetical protein
MNKDHLLAFRQARADGISPSPETIAAIDDALKELENGKPFKTVFNTKRKPGQKGRGNKTLTDLNPQFNALFRFYQLRDQGYSVTDAKEKVLGEYKKTLRRFSSRTFDEYRNLLLRLVNKMNILDENGNKVTDMDETQRVLLWFKARRELLPKVAESIRHFPQLAKAYSTINMAEIAKAYRTINMAGIAKAFSPENINKAIKNHLKNAEINTD